MAKNIVKRIMVFLLALLFCISLVACDSNNYEKAEALYNNGDYSAALEIYTSLGEYEDSLDKATRCKYIIANNHFENAEYKAALDLYVELGKYEDVQDRAAYCEREVGMTENADYAFLRDIESSVLETLETADNPDDAILINTELECIGKYTDETFYNAELKAVADKYIEGLHMQEDALSKESKYQYQIFWQKGLILKYEALNELYSKYNFLSENTAFVDTYIDSLEYQQYILDGYHAIYEDITSQENEDDFRWYSDDNNNTMYCILTNNTEYTFGIFVENSFEDANGVVFDINIGHAEDIIPGASYILEVSKPNREFEMSSYYYFDYIK